MTPLLHVKNLSKRYRTSGGLLGIRTGAVHALTDVNLTLNKGETLGLVGESGCGKTTLAKCIMGLEKPSSGSIIFKGKLLEQWNSKSLRRNMQLIFQDPYSSLNPRQRVGKAIREMLDIHNLGTRKQKNQKVCELLDLVGLSPEHADRYPHEFSGGQRQRIAVARALALDPELVVCDEPVSALDVSVQAQVLGLLETLQKSLELTYIFISHDLSVVDHISDRVAVMYLGRIVELAATDSLFTSPQHPYTKALLSAVLPPNPHKKSERIPLKGDLPSPTAPPQGCPFHPRCPEAIAKCCVQLPPLKKNGTSELVSCWLS